MILGIDSVDLRCGRSLAERRRGRCLVAAACEDRPGCSSPSCVETCTYVSAGMGGGAAKWRNGSRNR